MSKGDFLEIFSAEGKKERNMNVVLIVSDTFRRDHLGFYGNENMSTPNLDKFAKKNAFNSIMPMQPPFQLCLIEQIYLPESSPSPS